MKLFVYGTLMMPQMVVHLGLKVPLYVQATVTGYRKISTSAVPYPLLVEDHTGVLTGAIWPNITDEAYATVRKYEGPHYIERRVWAHDRDGAKHDCAMFVTKELFKSGWTPEHAMNYWRAAAEKAKEA